ncbi:hypothetical protein [Geothrix fuzhouensis]|uniref:hypothetical protein n=1 Tax=Geothrix fuzhouensis TaxID=2966451 RepID=UPI002148743D|nr:hypothetical protein [Geothrix fuzhouensis]
MRQNLIAGTLLCLLAACGRGGDATTQTPAPPPAPAWQAPVELANSSYMGGALLAGDGKGAVLAAWMRTGVDAGGTPYWEQVAARLRADGTWEPPQTLDGASGINGLQFPVAALDAQGKGLIAWFDAVPRSTTTRLQTVPVDLGSPTPFGARATALTVDLKAPTNLHLATGADGSALAAWSGLRMDPTLGVDFPTVQAARLEAGGAWGTPQSHHLNMYSSQFLHDLAGDGRGAYTLDFSTGDDASVENEAVDYAMGANTPVGIAGWGPLSQQTLPTGHPSVWSLDAEGRLETWLLYGVASEGDAQRQAWPRSRATSGAWTVGDKVSLPLPARSLVAFRATGDTGWMAGLGSEGLWVAPLSGAAPGTPRTLLPMSTTTEVMVGTRDASGRPVLLWIQRGAGGVHEGVGFSRWDGAAWTAPALLPGTAGKTIQSLFAVPGPRGLLAGWVEVGDRVLLFRTALWK